MDTTFLVIFYGFLAFVAGGHFLLNVLPIHLAARRAVTPEQMRDVVIKRLVRSYERERHPDPIRAACDHLSGMEDIERYRRWACEEYMRTGKTIRELEDEWISLYGRRLIPSLAHLPGHDRVSVARYNAVVADAIRNTPASDVFMYEPAATKWRQEEAAFERKHEENMRTQKLDPVASYVAEATFAAGNRI